MESATNKTSADPEYATPRNRLEKLANVPRPSYVTSKKPASHNEIINVTLNHAETKISVQ